MKKRGVATGAKTTHNFDAQKYVKPGFDQDQVLEIKEAFDLFDIDSQGCIDPKQLKATMKAQGFETKNQTLYQMTCELVGESAGSLGFEDFLQIMTANSTIRDSREKYRKVFVLFDDEKTGFVSVKNLRRIVKELGENISENELSEMIDRADLDNDGLVSQEQFYLIMVKGK